MINFPNQFSTYISIRYVNTCSGGYSNLRAQGKNFQKLMLSEKKKRSDLGLHIFLRNSWCPLKKKGLHFDFIFYFPIFLPKSGSSLKKMVFSSICSQFSLFLSQSQGVSKKKKVFTWNCSLNKHLQQIQNCMCYFRRGA